MKLKFKTKTIDNKNTSAFDSYYAGLTAKDDSVIRNIKFHIQESFETYLDGECELASRMIRDFKIK